MRSRQADEKQNVYRVQCTPHACSLTANSSGTGSTCVTQRAFRCMRAPMHNVGLAVMVEPLQVQLESQQWCEAESPSRPPQRR
eukprot:5063596-Pleurochrysis_carterae.AAC.1